MAEKITSTRNEWVQQMRALHGAKGRQESGLFLIEGEKLLRDALAAKWPIAYCLYEPARATPLAQELAAAGIQIREASRVAIEAASTLKTPQGIVAAAHLPQGAQCVKASPLLALDGVQDAGNVGTMLRTAEATGFGGVLLGAGTAEAFSPKVVRASMGSVFRMATERVDDLAHRLRALREEGYQIVGTAAQGGSFFDRGEMRGPRVLVIGSEGQGIGEDVLKVCDRLFALPMAGQTESFNAAVSAGIMMYDWFREG